MKQITLCLLSAILSLPSLSLATNLHDQEAGQESSCPADCAKPCCAEGDQQQKKSSCPTDCAKPCCAEGDQQQKKSSCSKDKSKDCTKSSCSKPSRSPVQLVLPQHITITPVAALQARAVIFDQDDPEANDPIVHGDPGLREGISLRRIRVGVEASWRNSITLRVVGGWDNRYDALQASPQGPNLVEALFRVKEVLPLELEMGLGRVPFGRQAQISSALLALVERSMASELIAPTREPIFTMRGAIGPRNNRVLPEQALHWAVAISNGDAPWSGDPNPSPRITGRLRLDLLRSWDPREAQLDVAGFAVSLGGSISHNWGLEARTLSGGADLAVQLKRVSLQAELLLSQATPTFDTEGLPSLLSERSSLGWYGQLGVAILPGRLVLAVRAGGYDDNNQLADAGDRIDIGGGLNLFLAKGHLKAQLHYIHRMELSEGHQTDNDSLVFQVQAML